MRIYRDDETLRQTTARLDGSTNARFAAACTLVARGVKESDGAVKDRIKGGASAGFIDGIAIGVGHVAEGRCAEADGGDGEAGATKVHRNILHENVLTD